MIRLTYSMESLAHIREAVVAAMNGEIHSYYEPSTPVRLVDRLEKALVLPDGKRVCTIENPNEIGALVGALNHVRDRVPPGRHADPVARWADVALRRLEARLHSDDVVSTLGSLDVTVSVEI